MSSHPNWGVIRKNPLGGIGTESWHPGCHKFEVGISRVKFENVKIVLLRNISSKNSNNLTHPGLLLSGLAYFFLRYKINCMFPQKVCYKKDLISFLPGDTVTNQARGSWTW